MDGHDVYKIVYEKNCVLYKAIYLFFTSACL